MFVKVWAEVGSVPDNLSSLEPFWVLAGYLLRKDAGLPSRASVGEWLGLWSGKFPSFPGGKHRHF